LSQRMRISLFSAVILAGLFSYPDTPFSALDIPLPAGTGRDVVRPQNERNLHGRQSHIKIAQETPKEIEMEPGNGQTPIPQPLQQPQQVQPAQRGQTTQQEQAQQPAPRPQIIPPTTQPPPLGRPLAKRGEVSFNFDDADVFSVIQTIFGDILKVNYIVDPNVKGRVNFRSVTPVAREDVLPLMEVILRLNGAGVVEEGGLYRIIPISDLSREPSPVGIGRNAEKVSITGKSLLQVVPVYNVQSSELVRVLTPFLSKNAIIVDVPKGNYVIIVDTDANVKRLLQLVEIFDSEQLAKIKPHVYVYPIQNGKAKDVSSLLQQIFLGAKPTTPEVKPSVTQKPAVAPGQTTPPTTQPVPAQSKVIMGSEGGEALVSELTRIISDEITNSLIILSTPGDYEIIAETIQKIDIMPRQVMIEALLVSIVLTDNLSFGFAWSMTTDVWPKYLNLAGDIFLKPLGTNLLNIPPALPAEGFTFVAMDPTGQVRAKITAALKESKGKVLAAPHILVSDNREARIQVGSQVPLATSATTTPITGDQGVTSSTTSTIQYKDIGIILKVKPQVNDSGLISLELSQEVSSIGEKVIAGGTENVSINKTEATTNLVARDGDTIIIGGLIREDTTKSKEGIPILSRIPLLGALFSRTTDDTQRTELMMLLTPRVIRSMQDAGDVTSDYIDNFKRGTKDKRINQFLKGKEYKKGDTRGPDRSGTQKDGDAKGANPPPQ